MRTILSTVLLFLLWSSVVAARPAEPASSTNVFSKYKHAVARIALVDRASQKSRSIGSGFFVGKEKFLVTNYHVVSDLIFLPERYRLRVENEQSADDEAQVIAFDIVHDLAVLSTSIKPPMALKLLARELHHGDRAFSIGNPRDLGSSIVEGTFNGIAKKMYPLRYHFSGAINQGMSGGPTITGSGEVLGVNVSSYGDEMSFLVPSAHVRSLLDTIGNTETAPRDSKKKFPAIHRQLLQHQDELIKRMLETPFERASLGTYRVPTFDDNLTDCSSDHREVEEQKHTDSYLSCSSGDDIYLQDEVSTGTVRFRHGLVEGKDLNRFQFYQLFQGHVSGSARDFDGGKKDFSTFRCKTTVTEVNQLPLKVWQCMRGYRELPELIDAVLYLATLDEKNSGLYSELQMRGVSLENYQKLSSKFLDQFQKIK